MTLTVRVYEHVTDPRLGRHVLHDSRSLLYTVGAVDDPRTLTSVRHAANIPILNQGNLGSCTGNAGTANMASIGFWPSVATLLSKTDGAKNETWAVGLYSQATALDPWKGQYPPTDTGSDGLSVAKALKARGLISGYQHATSRDATLTALAKQAVMVGTDWHEDMFQPAADGRLSVTGDVAGGHEYVLDELDVEHQRVWMRNSWGASWGIDGRAWMSWDDLGTLLSANGDCTVLTPSTEPPPTPDPEVALSPALAKALERFTPTKGCPKYLREAWADNDKE